MAIDNISVLRDRIPGGKYAMTRAVAARAQQLQNGAMPVTEVKTPNPITVAIAEILEGKISFEIKEGTEAEANARVAAEAQAKADSAREAAAAAALQEVPATETEA